MEFLEYLAAVKGLDADASRRRIDELLSLVNLADVRKRPLGGYSGGMKQRVGIAQALLNDPLLLIVDEPTAGLDPEERVRFRNLLSDLSGERIVILSTHIVSDVEAAATDIALISQGTLVAHASPEELLRQGREPSLGMGDSERGAERSQAKIFDQQHSSPQRWRSRAVCWLRRRRRARSRLRRLSRTRTSTASRATGPRKRRRSNMKTARMLYHLARADFLERVRRYSFLITLGLTIYLAYISAPPNHSTYITMEIAGHRAIYNSAYIGTMVAMESVLLLSLAGFYVVRNALDRDLRTGVGRVLATTPLSRPMYTIGKAVSNFAVLAAMVGVVAVAAGAMQFVRHEDTRLHIWALLSPFLFMVLPAMAIVASLAILFETISWLRGGSGQRHLFFRLDFWPHPAKFG